MKKKLEEFIERMIKTGVEVKRKKHYIKFNNVATIISNKKSLKICAIDGFQIEDLDLSPIVGKVHIGRFKKCIIVNSENVDAVLGKLENALLTL